MSRAEETYDNAHAESLFSRYKAELLEGGAFADVEQARMETFTYIESYYNRVRRHSALGYQSPENFERAYYQRTEARENFSHRPGKDTIAKRHSCPLKRDHLNIRLNIRFSIVGPAVTQSFKR